MNSYNVPIDLLRDHVRDCTTKLEERYKMLDLYLSTATKPNPWSEEASRQAIQYAERSITLAQKDLRNALKDLAEALEESK